jgi:Spy/CpxP family protein refolding chaperone
MNKQRNTTLKYLLSGILLMTAAGLHAQTPGNAGDPTMRHHPFRHGDFGHNREHLRFTPEQRTQLMSINKEYRQKRADLYKQDNLTLKQYKASLLALEKEKKARVQGIFTQQQKDEVAANRKKREENHLVREAAYMERLKLHLNLTDDQIAKIKTANEGMRAQAKAIHENDNLLPDEKREQMQTLMSKRNENFKTILTPDQYTQFQTMMSHHHGGGRGFQRDGGGFHRGGARTI